jgi:hypothetical protein
MPTRIVRVFVASPGDVLFERDALSKLINEINQTITAVAPEKDIRLELVRWETHAVPAAGRAQGVINDQIGHYDIFVGIMWRRFGTPSTEAESGTEEEFDRAYNEFQQRGMPHIMFYFCQEPASPPKSKQEVEQLMRVVAFRDRVSQLALVWEYGEHSDFAATVRPHILHGLKRVLTSTGRTAELTLSDDGAHLTNLGRQLTEFAQKYARVREALPPGDQRTRQLELIATEIRTAAFEGAPLITSFVSGTRPEERLVAVILLQVTPQPEHLDWLGKRLSERQPFLGYHAAVALLVAARTLDCSHSRKLDSAIALGLKHLGSKPGTDRHRTLLAAREELRTRCGM